MLSTWTWESTNPAAAVDLAEALQVELGAAVLVAGDGSVAVPLDAKIGAVDLGGEDVH
jgi:hypothetical protein